MARRLLGLEIGNTNIKLMEVEKKGTVWEIKHTMLIPTPSDSIKDGKIVDQKGLYELIKQAMENKKIRTKDVCILIQGSDIITRDAVIEAENEKHIEALLKVKVGEYLPIELSEYQVDYKILKKIETEGKKKFSILLVAAPKKIVLPIVNLVTNLKLKPRAISISLDTIGRMFEGQLKLLDVKTQTNLVIDLGGKSTTLSIVDGGLGVLNKEVPFGLEDVNQLIMKEFGSKNLKETEVFKKLYGAIYESEESKDKEDAENNAYEANDIYQVSEGYTANEGYVVNEEYAIGETYIAKESYNVDEEYRATKEAMINKEEIITKTYRDNCKNKEDEDFYGHYISNIIRPKIERRLIPEINRFIQFYYSRDKNSPIEAVYLIGGGANLKNIEHYLEAAINLPTYKALQFKSIRAKSKSDFQTNSLYFVNLLGLVSGI